MVFNERQEVCPVCGEKAKITRKWVLNNYGKRYDYFIFHHQGFDHYSNQSGQSSKLFKKGQLEKLLIETINSQEFRLGSFRIQDVRKLLVNDFPNIGFGSIKVSLNKLTKVGVIERRKKGRSLHYINTVSKDRLSYTINSLTIALEDIDKDYTFKKHAFLYKIRNDHSWPLHYVPFQAVGDVDAKFDDLRMQAYDPSNSKEIKVMLLEDAPMDKRVLLKLPTPLLPEEVREIKIEYSWSEPKQVFAYSSATMTKTFEFSVSGNNSTKLSASLASAAKNESIDLSSSVAETSSARWKHASSIRLADVEPFSVLQFKWERILSSISKRKNRNLNNKS